MTNPNPADAVLEALPDRKFYVGISECGCYSAMLVDDEKTTPKEIAEFARRMQNTKRRMGHIAVPEEQLIGYFKPCQHKEKKLL